LALFGVGWCYLNIKNFREARSKAKDSGGECAPSSLTHPKTGNMPVQNPEMTDTKPITLPPIPAYYRLFPPIPAISRILSGCRRPPVPAGMTDFANYALLLSWPCHLFSLYPSSFRLSGCT
jgi:hypothetical protein